MIASLWMVPDHEDPGPIFLGGSRVPPANDAALPAREPIGR
jgi:hypothetical protein